MWLLRRKTEVPKAGGEVLPSSTGPMRRIEITVERHSIARLSLTTAPEPEETVEPQPGWMDKGDRR